MDVKFKAWIIDQHEKFPIDKKQIFLRLLKSDPEKVLQIISNNITDWAIVYSMQTSEMSFAYNHNEICRDILKAFKEHFAVQLAEVA